MLFEDYMDYMFCYAVNKFFNFSKNCLKKHLQFVMQLIIEENDLIFCYLIKYVQIVHLDHHLDPDPDFPKNFFFLNFYFSLCHYYEILTNLPLNKSEGPYTTKLVKL